MSKYFQNEATMSFWGPLGVLSALSSIQQYEKEPPNRGFWELFWFYVRHVGAHMEDQVAKKSVQETS